MSNNKDQKTDDTQKLIKGSEYYLEQREDLPQKWDEYWEELIKHNPIGGKHE
ncbi:hypothetical protein SAMN04487977_11053 [Treponema bryantii]|uniref:Uncharacterized protein n=1 Tax=Treponema bryantii TaxID=163 RepID=A0A1H9IPE0_9SPIR|nr:hypothetical protein [Treponema bryantii]SEQ76377.1 hypothetical protein SAMN04487977_11053 [Treponema bryantii]